MGWKNNKANHASNIQLQSDLCIYSTAGFEVPRTKTTPVDTIDLKI